MPISLPRYNRSGFLLLGLILTGVAGAQEYKVALDRPQKVGQTYTISATGSSKSNTVVTVPGQVPQNQSESYTVALDGTVKVLAIDAMTSQATKLEITVTKALRDDKPVLQPGVVIVAENVEGKTVFTSAGMPVDQAAGTALDVVISTHQPGEPSDNAVFGTDKPQKVGDTWAVDSDAAARGSAKSGLPVDKNDIKGEVKLAGVEKVNGKDVLHIEADLNVAKMAATLPNGPKIDSGTMKAHFEAVLPADDTSLPISESQSTQFHLSMTSPTPDNQSAKIDVDASRSNKISYGDVK
jgi:hypothetical protein